MSDTIVNTHTIEALLADFVPPKRATEPVKFGTIEAAYRTSRQWQSNEPGAWRTGSEVHKREVSKMFRETFNPYQPSIIVWPEMSDQELRRLRSLPIWDIAVHTEGRARLHFAAYANSLADTEMRSAILLNAWEENRHKEVLTNLVRTYGIQISDEPPYTQARDLEWAYLVTGFSECIDSFFAFGLFRLAQQSGFFPVELVETFEPVIQEECRHILLFANWLAWHRANLSWWRRLHFEGRVVAVWLHIFWLRIGIARSMGSEKDGSAQDSNFTVTGAQSVSPVEVRFSDLMRLCLVENDRRFAGYDGRLVRPKTIPMLVRFALRVSGFWKRQKPQPT